MMTARQLGAALCLSPAAIARLRRQRVIPAIRLNARVFRYRMADVESALQQRELRAVEASASLSLRVAAHKQQLRLMRRRVL